jgi:metacaspase-1
MAKPLKVLCVHGVNVDERDERWQAAWTRAIAAGLEGAGAALRGDPTFVTYNRVFEKYPITLAGTVEAVAKLVGSGLVYAEREPVRVRGLADELRWTAGMVVQWVENERLRAQLRRLVAGAIAAESPDVILAHSLGSLLVYDALTRPLTRAIAPAAALVSFGSQIGSPFVRAQFGGRIVMPACRAWVHLFNKHDKAFTAPLRLHDTAFVQVDTPFDIEGFLDHDADRYLEHPRAAGMWQLAAGPAAAAESARGLGRAARRAPSRRKPVRRALLVGINAYPRKEDRLEGCVNDVFLVSSVLQECGFDAEDIRVVLDERATARGILERLDWLLDGAGTDDQRVFFYSGHGAQIPAYGADEKVDHQDECLVPWDFDWTREKAVVDDALYDLYSQLPYDTRFAMILDCCHSGGMTRGDGGARIRGLTPPDDIRHRMLRWNADFEMWVARDFKPLNKALARRPEYAGSTASVRRLGRGTSLLTLSDAAYARVTRAYDTRGPYLPLIIEACREAEYSCEYRHGVTSYGAFTYSFARILRNAAKKGRAPTFAELVRLAGVDLVALGYDQHPVILGPAAVTSSSVPWRVEQRSAGRAGAQQRRAGTRGRRPAV